MTQPLRGLEARPTKPKIFTIWHFTGESVPAPALVHAHERRHPVLQVRRLQLSGVRELGFNVVGCGGAGHPAWQPKAWGTSRRQRGARASELAPPTCPPGPNLSCWGAPACPQSPLHGGPELGAISGSLKQQHLSTEESMLLPGAAGEGSESGSGPGRSSPFLAFH